ncbi:MAG: VOC family protein [Aeromonas salmonicida]
MPSNPVNWFELDVSEMFRARRFYETVLDLSLTNIPSPEGGEYWTFPMQDSQVGAGGALIQHETTKPGPKRVIGTYGFIAICQATEGNPFGLYSKK